MKTVSLFSLCALIATTQFAQAPLIQSGLVREQNSGKRPVADVQIIFAAAVPVTSDQAGKFRLAFADKKAGDLAFMTEITKKGYEVVNTKEVEQVILSSTNQLGADIILAKTGVIDLAKKDYYAISDKALKAGFDKEKTRLRTALQNAKVSQQDFQRQYEALQRQYDGQKKELDNLSEKFATVNFDDVSPLYKEALQLFKDGKIEDAIQKLEGADLNKQTEKIITEEKNIAADEQALAERKKIVAKTKKEQIESIQLLANLYATKFEVAKAETQYDQLFLLDSTNLDILLACAEFYKQNHRYRKALHLYPKIIEHPQADISQKIYAYSGNGDMFAAIGQFDNALNAYTEYEKICAQLIKENTSVAFYKNRLAANLTKQGDIYAALGDFNKALGFYEDCQKTMKELCAAFPKFVHLKNGLAVSSAKLGTSYTALNNLDKALSFFEDCNNLMKEVTADEPENQIYKDGLAVSYEKLGRTHKTLGNLDKALIYTEEQFKLHNALYAAYPSSVNYKNAVVIAYERLGTTHASLGNLDKALNFYQERTRLSIELYQDYPTNPSFKNSVAISYSRLGLFYKDQKNDIEKARFYLNQCDTLLSELIKSFPRSAEYQANSRIIRKTLSELTPSVFALDPSGNAAKAATDYKKAILEAATNAQKMTPQYQLVALYEKLFTTYKASKADTLAYLDEINNLAYYQLFAKQFAEAEKTGKRGFELDARHPLIKSNIAPALLLQSRYAEAEKLYTELKTLKDATGTSFAKACLNDLDALEKAGITHRDVAKIRTLLKE